MQASVMRVCHVAIVILSIANTSTAFSYVPNNAALSRLPRSSAWSQTSPTSGVKACATSERSAKYEAKLDFVHRSIQQVFASVLAATVLVTGPVGAVTEGQTTPTTVPAAAKPAATPASGNFELPNLGGLKIPDDFTKELEKFPGDITKQINSIKVCNA